jgi:hypothetical protein
MSPNFATTTRKLEDLPSDGGRAVDTLAGAILRIFVRLAAIEEAHARLGRRLAALEGPQPAAVNDVTAVTCTRAETPSPTPPNLPAGPPKGSRGRPPGSPNRPKNGAALVGPKRPEGGPRGSTARPVPPNPVFYENDPAAVAPGA